MDTILSKIIEKQNQILLEKICDKYQLDKKRIFQQYHTPSFYKITSDGNNYKIIMKHNCK